MNFKEAQKQMYERSTLKEKFALTLWGIFFDLQHHFRRITKICPHDSTFGGVNAKKVICIDCLKEVDPNQ